MVRRLRGVLQGPIVDCPICILAQRLADVETRAREVDVGHAQAEQLAAAQAGGEVEHDGHVEAPSLRPLWCPYLLAVPRSCGGEQRRLLGRRVDVERRRLVVGQLDVVASGSRRCRCWATAAFMAAPTNTRCLRTVLAERPLAELLLLPAGGDLGREARRA